MKVCVFGAGYVGLVTAACLSEMGNSVVCVDIDEARVAGLQRGEMPIHEPGLAELVRAQRRGRPAAVHHRRRAGRGHGTIVFIAVGTPAAEDGSADLEHVLAAATDHRHATCATTRWWSTRAPCRWARPTACAQRDRDRAEAPRRRVLPFAVVSNPEFLKEGAAIDDFMRPDRIVVGADDEQATLLMRALYAPFQRNHDRLLLMDVRSAELTKYVANAMLATRISFMNEMATLAERLGADIELVRQGIGSDPRIGTHFLYAGCGWGGSCLPKDVKALRRMGGDAGLRHADPRRRAGGQRPASAACSCERVVARFGDDLRGRVVRALGPGLQARHRRPARGAQPGARSRNCCARRHVCRPSTRWPCRPSTRASAPREGLALAADPYAAAEGADALLVVTEWREFRSPDFERLARRDAPARRVRRPQPLRARRRCATRLRATWASAGLRARVARSRSRRQSLPGGSLSTTGTGTDGHQRPSSASAPSGQ